MVDARDVVEDVGFGYAQWRILVLGSSIWLLDGMTTAFTPVVLIGANAFNMTEEQKTNFLALSFACMCVGTALGGYVGDVMGRRPAILFSYLGIFVFCASMGLIQTSAQLYLCYCALMFSQGFGSSPSTTLQSEVTPEAYRLHIMAGRGVLTALGFVIAGTALCLDDPELLNVHWRLGVVFVQAPLAALFGAAAAVLLPESPVFYAVSGDACAALDGFASLRRSNNLDEHLPLKMTMPRVVRSSSLRLQLGVLFDRRTFACTVVLVFTAFIVTITKTGHDTYEPIVLAHQTESAAAVQMLLEGFYSGIASMLLVPVSSVMSCRVSAYAMTYLLCAFCCVAFSVIVATSSSYSALAFTVLLQVVAWLFRLAFKFQTLLGTQIATESYPRLVAATGTSASLALGKLGAVVVPYVFEVVSHLSNAPEVFWLVLAILQVLAFGCIMFYSARLRELSRVAQEVLEELQ